MIKLIIDNKKKKSTISNINKIKRKSTNSSVKVPPTVKKLTLTWENLNVYKPKSSFYYLKTKLGQHAYKEDKHIVKNGL